MERAREYAFLLFAVAVAALYAIVHDQITVTISPEYFIYGKGVSEASLRWGAAWVAVRATAGMGLLVGTALLVANAPPGPRRPGKLEYATLVRFALIPLVAASAGAAIVGLVNAYARIGESTAVAIGVPLDKVGAFVTVWGVHLGSYLGAFAGTLVSALLVWRRSRAGRPR